MFTQCPHCHAIYRLDAQTLAAAAGRVQCGACEQPFDALASLRDEVPESGSRWENTELPFEPPDASPGADGESALQPSEEPEEAEAEAPVPSSAPPESAPPAWEEPARRGSQFWAVASAALGLALVVQLVFLAPPVMAGHESLRPVARILCGVSGCTVPPRQALDRLRLASRDVRAHPSVPGALIISATLVNEAEFTQSYPVLEISLGDLEGDQVALRRFRPSAYVPESVDVARGMAPGSRVQVSLEVVDPGEAAVAFRFAFRSSRDR